MTRTMLNILGSKMLVIVCGYIIHYSAKRDVSRSRLLFISNSNQIGLHKRKSWYIFIQVLRFLYQPMKEKLLILQPQKIETTRIDLKSFFIVVLF